MKEPQWTKTWDNLVEESRKQSKWMRDLMFGKVNYLVIDDSKNCLSQAAVKPEDVKLRIIEDTPDNFDKENLRQSLRIAKLNHNIDPENKYYAKQFRVYQEKWDCLTENKTS